jgi:polyhydroxyalkanoate synthesis regulator phasin
VTENDGLRRYLKAGMTFTEVTRSRADELLRELIKTGEIERHKAQDWVGDLVKTSGGRSVAFISTVRGEVRKPLKGLGFTNVDDLAEKGGDTPLRSSTAAPMATGCAVKKAPVKKAPVKKAPVKKTAATKTAARKAPAKKTAKTAGA